MCGFLIRQSFCCPFQGTQTNHAQPIPEKVSLIIFTKICVYCLFELLAESALAEAARLERTYPRKQTDFERFTRVVLPSPYGTNLRVKWAQNIPILCLFRKNDRQVEGWRGWRDYCSVDPSVVFARFSKHRLINSIFSPSFFPRTPLRYPSFADAVYTFRYCSKDSTLNGTPWLFSSRIWGKGICAKVSNSSMDA